MPRVAITTGCRPARAARFRGRAGNPVGRHRLRPGGPVPAPAAARRALHRAHRRAVGCGHRHGAAGIWSATTATATPPGRFGCPGSRDVKTVGPPGSVDPSRRGRPAGDRRPGRSARRPAACTAARCGWPTVAPPRCAARAGSVGRSTVGGRAGEVIELDTRHPGLARPRGRRLRRRRAGPRTGRRCATTCWPG